jgi:hypothetical protein
MQASILDLRYHMRDILKALDRNEPVHVLFRGKAKGVLMPLLNIKKTVRAGKHKAFGMWKNNEKLKNVEAYVRNLRATRFDSI